MKFSLKFSSNEHKRAVITDNIIFRLHYKVTTVILVIFFVVILYCIRLTGLINCVTKDYISVSFMDLYCYFHPTFTVPDAWNKTVGEEIPYLGIDNYNRNEKLLFYGHYPWVGLLFLVQALLFCVPQYIWRSVVNGLVADIVMDLNRHTLSHEKRETQTRQLVDYVVDNASYHKKYAYFYLLSEVLNVVNVIGQIFLTDSFLNGQFLNYGSEIMNFREWDISVLKYDPMSHAFPYMTKCTIKRYGSSGHVQRHDAMCALPLNTVYSKMYAFLWFWFVFLTVASTIALLHKICLYASPGRRALSLRVSNLRLKNAEHVNYVVQRVDLGDWFILRLLSKNLHPSNMLYFMKRLSTHFEEKTLDEMTVI